MSSKKLNFICINMEKDLYLISDNCWGAAVYKSIKSQYLSPFVYLYIHPSDYIKLLYNLDDYLNCKLTEVNYEDSNHFKLYNTPKNSESIIAKLNDIEIIFYHTNSENSEKIFSKWYKRKQRLTKDKNQLLLTFGNDIMRYPGFSEKNDKRFYSNFEELLEKFYKLPYGKKVSFTESKYNFPKNYVIQKKHKNPYILGLNHKYYIRDIFSL